MKHYAAAVTAFVIWGFFAIPLRALAHYSSGEILYFRILFSTVILAVILLFRRREIGADWRQVRALTVSGRRTMLLLTFSGGVLLTLNWLTFIYIVNQINVKTASFSYLICPVITAVLGYALLRESLSRIQWVAVALCAVSCIMMGLNSRMELAYSFLTAFTYALYLISQRRNQGFDRILVLAAQVSFALVILSVAFPLLVDALPVEGRFYTLILIVALFFTVLPLFLNLFALNSLNSATIGILMYLNPLINFTVAFVVYDEKISALQLVGYVIILGALLLFNLNNLRRLRASVATSAS
ncbi:MAG TPA: EamA family transporter [Chryseosolibacter sp.]|nr:EamA family transporter [Chryseosolibacter sp.]